MRTPRRRHGTRATGRELDPATLGDHIDRLYRAARAMTRSRVEAEDLVQDTYARVLAKPRILRDDDDAAYLLRTLRNTFISKRRATARRPLSVALDERAEIADPRGSLRPDRAAETREVFASISALPPDFRDTLIAVDVVGLSHREAAHMLDTKEATIATRLFRARGQVARELTGALAGS